MNVLFLPHYDDNPYQDELRRGLNREGVTVTTGDYTAPLPVLQSFARQGVPDVLHLHWAHSLLVSRGPGTSLLLGVRLFLELLVARALGVRVVWTVHNRLHHERRFPRLERRLRSVLARLCDDIIVHGFAARETIVETYDIEPYDAESVHVIPHGSYVEYYENSVDRADARRRLDLDEAATVFLFFGNIRPYKNVTELVEVFGDLDDENAVLLVAGRPPEDDVARAELERRCAADERVRTTFGFIPEEDIQLYMNAADAVVLPFDSVLTSGSTMLAMSFGRPVVAPRLGCIPEHAGEADDLLYDPTAPDGLARALRRATRRDLDDVGAEAFRRSKQFDWPDIAAQTVRVYRGKERTSVSPNAHPDLVPR